MRLPGRFQSCLLLMLLMSIPAFPTLAGPTSTSSERGRAVYFELDGPGGTGVVDPGKPVHLSVYIRGASGGGDPIVAIFEGKPFVRRLVPMAPQPDPNTFHSSVTLEPEVTGFISQGEKALRVNVIFARRHGMRLTRFMTRSVYVTMRLPREVMNLSAAPSSETTQKPPGEFWPDLSGGGGPAKDEARDSFSEEDLIAGSVQTEGQGYWQQISNRISRSWNKPLGSFSRKKPKGVVTVRFQLHANGEVQLVQVERSSGMPQLDDAGMKAILNAHPFPPFPANLPHEWVDMHVELGRSAPAVARDMHPASPLDRPAGSR